MCALPVQAGTTLLAADHNAFTVSGPAEYVPGPVTK
eukprot:gene4610-4819_t